MASFAFNQGANGVSYAKPGLGCCSFIRMPEGFVTMPFEDFERPFDEVAYMGVISRQSYARNWVMQPEKAAYRGGC
jgi:hypothetical protein